MKTLSARLAHLALACLAGAAHAEVARDPLTQDAVNLARQSARPSAGLRVEVEAGSLDPRLKLAPCQQVESYLPAGFRPWGKTRVGLRCLQGTTRWNVYLPITVKVYGRALVAATALPAGSVIGAADLKLAEIDLAADSAPAIVDAGDAIGRTLSRTLGAGEILRQGQLRARQWFAAGDTVKLVAVGAGFAVHGEGQALAAGLEGSTVRVRTDSGRIVTGTAVSERRVELKL